MDHGKKKFTGSQEVPKKGPPLGLVIALAAAGGVVIGSAGTYFFFKPSAAPGQSAAPAAGGTPPAQALTVPARPPQPQQFTPAPQPPGDAPPGKVWSVEHGHWHDAPGGLGIPALTPTATVSPPASASATVTPALAPPAPAAPPAEKKE